MKSELCKNCRRIYRLAVGTILISLSFALVSCGDDGLAKKVVGDWYGSYENTYSNGCKEKIDVTWSFKQDGSNAGGKFTEKHQGNYSGEADGINYQLEYESSIAGAWGVLNGDLKQNFDIATLEIFINPDQVKILNRKSYRLGNLDDVRTFIAKEARRSLFEELFDEYQLYNKANGKLKDLEVEDGLLSYDTDDKGRITMSSSKETAGQVALASAAAEPEAVEVEPEAEVVEVEPVVAEAVVEEPVKQEVVEPAISEEASTGRPGDIVYDAYVGKYPCRFTLNFSSEDGNVQQVNGTYRYLKTGSGAPIILRGRYNSASETLFLTEYYDDGTANSAFTLQKISDGFSGIFEDPQGKQLDVRLTAR